ncbi:hypothetical protein MCETE4_01913 [Acidimicrobiia bacterium]
MLVEPANGKARQVGVSCVWKHELPPAYLHCSLAPPSELIDRSDPFWDLEFPEGTSDLGQRALGWLTAAPIQSRSVAFSHSSISGQYQTFPCRSSASGTGKSACLYRQL